MDKQELEKVLANHKLWLEGKGGKKASLQGASLQGASLQGASLQGADLRDADLKGASLERVELYGANLQDANLQDANLYGTNLQGANLQGTCLDPNAPVPPISDQDLLDAGFEIQGVGEAEYVVGWRTKHSKFVGDTIYKSGKEYTAPHFSVCTLTDCHPGLYLAGVAYLDAYYKWAERVQVKCLRSELVKARDKFRAKRLWVL
jgi:hypothetical protein